MKIRNKITEAEYYSPTLKKLSSCFYDSDKQNGQIAFPMCDGWEEVRDMMHGLCVKADDYPIEIPVGESVKADGVLYKCVHQKPSAKSRCLQCCLYNNSSVCYQLECRGDYREDGRDVIFIELCNAIEVPKQSNQ